MTDQTSDDAPEQESGGEAGHGIPDYGIPGQNADMKHRIRYAITLAGGNKAVHEKSGVSVRNLQNYKSGGAMPNAETIGLIAKATDVSLNWLIYGDGPMQAGLAQEQSGYGDAEGPPLDEETLIDTIVVVEEVLAEAATPPSPEAKAGKVLKIYKEVMAAKARGESLSPVRVLRMVRERDEEA